MENDENERLFKVIVIGDIGTGKTSIIKRYVHDKFSMNYKSTIGVDFAIKELKLDDGMIVRLQLWDIAGQERFGNMTRVYYKDAVAAFIVLDVTRITTLKAVEKWKKDVDSKLSPNIPVVLLVNKSDLLEDGENLKNTDEIDKLVKNCGFAGWFKTSAKKNTGINESGLFLVEKILINDIKIYNDKIDTQIIKITPKKRNSIENKENKKNAGCC